MGVSLVMKAWAAVMASAWQKGAYSSRMVDRVVSLRALRRMEAFFCMWLVAIRNAHHEAKYRHQLIVMAAESSAGVYNLTREAKRTMVDLRKQRRAHGVAVIHGNLDRCCRLPSTCGMQLLEKRNSPQCTSVNLIYQRRSLLRAMWSCACRTGGTWNGFVHNGKDSCFGHWMTACVYGALPPSVHGGPL